MEVGHSVDLVRPNHAQIGHPDLLGGGLLHQRQHAELVVVARVFLAYLVEPEVVDQIDQFEVSGQQFADQLHTPLLQGLRQDCVVGI